MSNRISDVTEFLEQIAHLNYQENYDNSGLITGDPNWKISGVLTCLDTTLEVIQEAKIKGCNLIISHHPIIFRAIKKLDVQYYVDKVIIQAVKDDIAIYQWSFTLPKLRNGKYSFDVALANGTYHAHEQVQWINDALVITVKNNELYQEGRGLLIIKDVELKSI